MKYPPGLLLHTLELFQIWIWNQDIVKPVGSQAASDLSVPPFKQYEL
jgi:hypothetical protein